MIDPISFFLGGVLAFLGSAVVIYIMYGDHKSEQPSPEEKPIDKDGKGSVDYEMDTDIVDPDLDNIPEEDQEYLAPILSKLIQEYVPIKTKYASNAMLIEHLGKALGDASESFEKRRVASDDHQQENEDWLKVAAWAMRLYKEGTPHNSVSTLERFTMVANLSGRELKQYATRTMNQAGGKIKKIMDGEETRDPHVKDMKAPDVGDSLNPYTEDEIQDMKDANNPNKENRDNE